MDDFIGKGWSFPPHFNKYLYMREDYYKREGKDYYSGGVEMVADQQEIEESLSILFSTQLGERLFHNDFGSSLIDYQFADNDNITLLRIKEMITRAVKKHEPRITLEKVEVNTDNIMDGRLVINLSYTINATNSSYNMVYPYYFENSI